MYDEPQSIQAAPGEPTPREPVFPVPRVASRAPASRAAGRAPRTTSACLPRSWRGSRSYARHGKDDGESSFDRRTSRRGIVARPAHHPVVRCSRLVMPCGNAGSARLELPRLLRSLTGTRSIGKRASHGTGGSERCEGPCPFSAREQEAVPRHSAEGVLLERTRPQISLLSRVLRHGGSKR